MARELSCTVFPQGKWYVIIAVSQDIHVGSVGISSIETEDFSLLTLRLQVIPQSNQLSVGEYAKLLKSASIPTIALVELGKLDTCLMSFSTKLVFDSGATGHMKGNSSLFATFELYPSTSTVILADGSMIEEVNALNGNGTWDLVPFPAGKKAIGCC